MSRACTSCGHPMTVSEQLRRFARCGLCRKTHVKHKPKPTRHQTISIGPNAKAKLLASGTGSSWWITAPREGFTAQAEALRPKESTFQLREWVDHVA